MNTTLCCVRSLTAVKAIREKRTAAEGLFLWSPRQKER